MMIARIRATFPAFVAATLLSLALAPAAESNPIQATYSTTGTIGTTGITGAPDVSFQGVTNGTLTTGHSFSLGKLVLTPPSDGGTTTYGATPFQITFTVTNSSGDPALAGETPITLRGILDTFLNGTTPGQTVAIFLATSPPSPGTPYYNAYTYWLNLGSSTVYGLYPIQSPTLVPSTQDPGGVDVLAQMDEYATPEPSALTTLAVAMLGLIIKRHSSRAKRLHRSDTMGAEF